MRYIAILSLVVAIVVAGCGSSDDSTSTETVAPETESSQVAEEPAVVEDPDAAADGAAGAAAAAGGESETASKPIADAVRGKGESDVVGRAIDAAGDSVIQPGKQYTVFRPSDDVLQGIPQSQIDAALKPGAKGELAQTLRNHVVEGVHNAASLRPGTVLTALSGTKIEIGGTAQQPTANGFPIVQRDVKSKDGVVHVIGGIFTA